jgi:hypothetical protein
MLPYIAGILGIIGLFATGYLNAFQSCLILVLYAAFYELNTMKKILVYWVASQEDKEKE